MKAFSFVERNNPCFNDTYLFIFLFNVFVVYSYLNISFRWSALYGVYDSIVDYPYDDVVYCH